jgi:hypothetical protein
MLNQVTSTTKFMVKSSFFNSSSIFQKNINDTYEMKVMNKKVLLTQHKSLYTLCEKMPTRKAEGMSPTLCEKMPHRKAEGMSPTLCEKMPHRKAEGMSPTPCEKMPHRKVEGMSPTSHGSALGFSF